MAWIEKTVDTGKVIFVKKYWSSRYGTKGQIFRSSHSKKTTDAQETINNKIKAERFSILVNSNFGDGDYMFSFTYKPENRPANIDTAKEQWKKFLRKARRLYKSKGSEFKYCWCYEFKGKAPHFHLICNECDNLKFKDIRNLWEYGIVHCQIMDDREFHSVGEYMMKERFIKDEEGNITRCYGSSRNLYRPEPTYRVLENPNWDEHPKANAGYIIDDDSVENGEVYISEINATFRYQSYRMLKQKMNE